MIREIVTLNEMDLQTYYDNIIDRVGYVQQVNIVIVSPKNIARAAFDELPTSILKSNMRRNITFSSTGSHILFETPRGFYCAVKGWTINELYVVDCELTEEDKEWIFPCMASSGTLYATVKINENT